MVRVEESNGELPCKRISPEHFMVRFQRASSLDTDSGPSRLDGSLRATGEEQGPVPSSQGVYDVVEKNAVSSPMVDGLPEERSTRRCTKYYQIGTWNVRNISLGKLEIVKREMNRTYIDIVGISELHWTGSGQFQSNRFTVYFSGNDSVRRESRLLQASWWLDASRITEHTVTV